MMMVVMMLRRRHVLHLPGVGGAARRAGGVATHGDVHPDRGTRTTIQVGRHCATNRHVRGSGHLLLLAQRCPRIRSLTSVFLPPRGLPRQGTLSVTSFSPPCSLCPFASSPSSHSRRQTNLTDRCYRCCRCCVSTSVGARSSSTRSDTPIAPGRKQPVPRQRSPITRSAQSIVRDDAPNPVKAASSLARTTRSSYFSQTTDANVSQYRDDAPEDLLELAYSLRGGSPRRRSTLRLLSRPRCTDASPFSVDAGTVPNSTTRTGTVDQEDLEELNRSTRGSSFRFFTGDHSSLAAALSLIGEAVD